jgi:hypothetical protein
MKRFGAFVLAGLLVVSARAGAGETEDTENWRRVDSRYCTIWLHPSVELGKVNRKISTFGIRPRVKVMKGHADAGELASKCDTIFRRTEEILDMYPPGIHTTIKVAKERHQISSVHASRYGHGTKARAFYVFENNTIYAAVKDISEDVLGHEMAHCIIDHYFNVRPPRKIEEMLAMHVNEQLRD